MNQPSCTHPQSEIRLGVLLSGRGSNFSAILKAIETGQLTNTTIGVVISNRAEAPGLAVAKEAGIPALSFRLSDFEHREAFDQALADALQAHQVDLLVLAGYDRIVGNPLLKAFSGRILNIHPSLLPAYGGRGMVGLKVHEAVLANGELESGCTVHLVTEGVDEGPILGQSRVPVLATDTPESLAQRVLAEEHRLYPQVIHTWVKQHLSGLAQNPQPVNQQKESTFHHDDALV